MDVEDQPERILKRVVRGLGSGGQSDLDAVGLDADLADEGSLGQRAAGLVTRRSLAISTPTPVSSRRMR